MKPEEFGELPNPESSEDQGDQEDKAPEEDFEPVIIRLANEYLFEPKVLQLIQNALNLPAVSGLSHLFAQITPTGVLLAAIHEGRTNPRFHKDCEFLASEFSSRASLTNDSFKELLLDEILRESKSQPATTINQFPRVMEDTFQFAQELAVSCTGNKNVCMRHLIGSICLLVPGWGTKIRRDLLQVAHLDIDQLGPDFQAHVLRTYPTDNTQTWQFEFGKVFAPKPPGRALGSTSTARPQEDGPATTRDLAAVYTEQYFELTNGRPWLPHPLKWSNGVIAAFESISGRAHLEVTKGREVQFTPLLLFLGILNARANTGAEDFGAALRTAMNLDQGGFQRLFDEALFASDAAKVGSPSHYKVVSPSLETVLSKAVDLHRLTATEAEECVGVRHLTAALLEKELTPGTGAGEALRNAGIATSSLVEAFVRHLETSERFKQTDKNEAWQPIIARLRSLHLQTSNIEPDVKGEAAEALREWEVEFAKLRRESGFRWSNTLDRVLDLLWDEHATEFRASVRDPSRGKFEPQLTPRSLFLSGLLHGARHREDSRNRPDDRGQTLIRIFQSCQLSEERVHELLLQEFHRQPAPSLGETLQDHHRVSWPPESRISGHDGDTTARLGSVGVLLGHNDKGGPGLSG